MPDPHALPLHIQISEMLIREIQAGRRTEGDRLPPERQMAQDLGISVGTLRRALADLTEKGMLERVQGSGNYIRAKPDTRSVYAFFRVELLDGGGLPTAELLSLDRMDKPRDLPAFGTSEQAFRIRRLRRLNGTPAVLEEMWLDGACADRLEAQDLSESLYLFYRERLGIWISRAEDRLGQAPVPDWAPDAFGAAPGTPCLMAGRLSWAQDGRAVEFSRNWIDTEVATYVARIA